MGLIQDLADSIQLPWYITAIVLLLGAIGTFWKQISGFFIERLKGKNELAKIRAKSSLERIVKLEERIEILEERNRHLVTANTAMTSALMSMIDQYEEDNPKNKTMIAHVRKLITDSFYEEPKNEG